MSYTKLFSEIVTSTIWSEDDKTRIIWITMLATSNRHGEVMASVPGLAKIASVSIEDTRKAIEKLSSPDPDSRTPDCEGRRIEKIDGGWALINYEKYRKKLDEVDRKAAAAERQRRFRERRKSNAAVTESNGCHADVTESNDKQKQSAEGDTKKKKGAPPPPSAPPLPLPHGEKFRKAWERWIQHRIEIKKPLKPSQVELQLAKFGEMSETAAVLMIENSVCNGWQGLFPVKDQNGSPKTPPPKFDL